MRNINPTFDQTTFGNYQLNPTCILIDYTLAIWGDLNQLGFRKLNFKYLVPKKKIIKREIQKDKYTILNDETYTDLIVKEFDVLDGCMENGSCIIL